MDSLSTALTNGIPFTVSIENQTYIKLFITALLIIIAFFIAKKLIG